MPSNVHKPKKLYNKLCHMSVKHPSRAIGIMLLVTTILLDFVLLFTGWFEGGAFVSFLTISLITSAVIVRWNDIEAIELWGQKLKLKKMSEEAQSLLESLKNHRRQSISVELMRIHNSSIPIDADLSYVQGEIMHFSHVCDLALISGEIGEFHPMMIFVGRNLLAALAVRDEKEFLKDAKSDVDRIFKEGADFEAWVNLFLSSQVVLEEYADNPVVDIEKFGADLATSRVNFWNYVNRIIRPCLLSVRNSTDGKYIAQYLEDKNLEVETPVSV